MGMKGNSSTPCQNAHVCKAVRTVQCGPCSADRAVRTAERSGRIETGGRLEYINGVRCGRVAMNKIVETWQRQKRNHYNYEVMKTMNMYDHAKKKIFLKTAKTVMRRLTNTLFFFHPKSQTSAAMPTYSTNVSMPRIRWLTNLITQKPTQFFMPPRKHFASGEVITY
jgi:hypothetical protein